MIEAQAYLRTGKWGAVQTIVLSSRDMEILNGFRRQVTLWPYKGRSYDTFPRDVIIAKPDISILLRSSMKTFQTEIIPKVLFNRNADIIAGSLRVLSTRFHTAEETSHKGESKEYWRTIDLKGDEQLMGCLRTIPENRPFLLGYDAVQIRGGLRPQEITPMRSGIKRPWAEIEPSPQPLLADPRSGLTPFGHPNPARGASQAERGQRGNKRGRPFRGGRRGRFPRR